MSNLDKYLDKKVSELVAQPSLTLDEPVKERHRIYAHLLLSIMRPYWCGLKRGRGGMYPLNPSEAGGDVGNYLDSDYLGHNIAAIAVDGDGNVIDFEFNHNELYNSSAEHAEARLVQRVFSLVQVHDSWNVRKVELKPQRYATVLSAVTIYTSLESCSQCSGIMALGAVKEVVYLQRDPGMYFIGNILRRLTESTDLEAPLPIPADLIGMSAFDELNAAYAKFTDDQSKRVGPPFYQRPLAHPEYTQSLTSFLCTKAAYDVYRKTEAAFDQLTAADLAHPAFKPHENAKTNAECLDEAKSFRNYAVQKGRRATPHQ